MAHATARSVLPVDGPTLQPRVAPTRPAGDPLAAPLALLTASRAVAPARVLRGAVAAAARAVHAPVFTGAGARALETQASPAEATAPSARRFVRSGPLAFALPPLAAALPVREDATARAPSAVRSARRAAPVRAFAAPEAGHAPVSAVTTPAGVWMSARAAAATPGLRVLRTEAGRLVALAPAPVGTSAEGTRDVPRTAVPRAPVTRTLARPAPLEIEDPLSAPQAPPRRRAMDWAGQRQRVAEATAYRGAFRTAEPEPVAAAAEPAQLGAASRRDRPRRLSATAGAMSLPTPSGTPEAKPTTAARRGSLEDRLQAVAGGERQAAAPSWAARSDGAPQVRSVGGLFQALAKATTAEEIVRVIYARAEGVRETPLANEAPVVQVIEQIRQEVRREQTLASPAGEAATRPSRLDAPATRVLSGNAYVTPVPSTTRVNRGGVRGVSATARSMAAGSGDDRIMKLVKKLQGLIHLAEAEGRLADARRQVRMAEDSPGARAEAAGPVGAAKEQGDQREKQDIEALGREVLEVVNRELENRRMRRVEDHDESVWW
jgi:hypothetical protein